MTAKKKGPDRVVLDAVALDFPRPGTAPTIGELVTEGTNDDRRRVLSWIGMRVLLNDPRMPAIPEEIREWFGSALEEIGCGADPKQALGLNRKVRHGPWYRKTIAHLVDDLVAQGKTRADAESLVGRYNHDTKSFESDPSDKAGARVRKIIKPKIRKK